MLRRSCAAEPRAYVFLARNCLRFLNATGRTRRSTFDMAMQINRVSEINIKSSLELLEVEGCDKLDFLQFYFINFWQNETFES